jgi:hypothetical protein
MRKTGILIMKLGNQEMEMMHGTDRCRWQEPFCFCSSKISCPPGLLINKSNS